ncbi:MAG: hypothetical protein B9S32_00345 [Verrucomicrobia bacterium Tous-C9LFEB]|nr:MAG: hypothetical protein B9S32_00345 [Verrucomicrobia bacterium Tous-C9LFEB]
MKNFIYLTFTLLMAIANIKAEQDEIFSQVQKYFSSVNSIEYTLQNNTVYYEDLAKAKKTEKEHSIEFYFFANKNKWGYSSYDLNGDKKELIFSHVYDGTNGCLFEPSKDRITVSKSSVQYYSRYGSGFNRVLDIYGFLNDARADQSRVILAPSFSDLKDSLKWTKIATRIEYRKDGDLNKRKCKIIKIKGYDLPISSDFYDDYFIVYLDVDTLLPIKTERYNSTGIILAESEISQFSKINGIGESIQFPKLVIERVYTIDGRLKCTTTCNVENIKINSAIDDSKFVMDYEKARKIFDLDNQVYINLK